MAWEEAGKPGLRIEWRGSPGCRLAAVYPHRGEEMASSHREGGHCSQSGGYASEVPPAGADVPLEGDTSPVVQATDADTMLSDFREQILIHLMQEKAGDSPLLRLWEHSYLERNVLVLPSEVATEIAAGCPEGYDNGIWYLVTEYERFVSQALLTNSNRKARGYGQPKSFSAWSRKHDVTLYRDASEFLKGLKRKRKEEGISVEDRDAYTHLIWKWHQSIQRIHGAPGHTRLDLNQLQDFCLSIQGALTMPPADRPPP